MTEHVAVPVYDAARQAASGKQAGDYRHESISAQGPPLIKQAENSAAA